MRVITPRRLHLGLIDPSGTFGRRFGSMGVALEGGYELHVTTGDSLKIRAQGEDYETIKRTVERMNGTFETGVGYSIEVVRSVPRHVGLGSTTQLSLAVASAVAKLNNLEVSTERLAEVLGRGRNGGAGIYTFIYGGFVLDGGSGRGMPPLIFREDFPEGWAFLLVTPETKPGLDEEEERPIMEEMEGRVDVAREISHRVLLGLLPALKERDIWGFGGHLSAIQRLVGKHFEAYQGGEFREDVKVVLEFLRANTYGCGQSSWGPTVYGLIQGSEYPRLRTEIGDYLKEHGVRAGVELGLPRNSGAEVISENTFLERLIEEMVR